MTCDQAPRSAWQITAATAICSSVYYGETTTTDTLKAMFIHAQDLRMTLELLSEQLLKAEEPLGQLENNICEDDD
jgi:hypothetical protein